MDIYEQAKDFVTEPNNKQKIITGICFVLVFLVGFGTGRGEGLYEKNKQQSKETQSKYTTKQGTKETGTIPQPTQTEAILTPPPAPTTTTGECVVKGNVSTSGNKIYHVKGGAFYDKVKPEQCFGTEQDAQAAGFRKSSR